MARLPLDELRALDRRDGDLRARSDRLRALDREVAAVRAAAEAIDAFFAAYPDEEARLRGALDEARAELERRGHERAQAERDLSEAEGEDARAAAERAVARTADRVSLAQARQARAQEAIDALEREAAELPRELTALEAQAARVAEQLADVPSPADDSRGLVDWASRAHASIFVSAGSVDTQRDRVVREASELASMLLGESTYGSTVAQLAARVEAALG